MTDTTEASDRSEATDAVRSTDSLDHGPRVLAGYALLQVFLLAFTYYAVTSIGLGRRGFMHVAMPWYLILPGVWLLVLLFALRALVPRIRTAAQNTR